MLYNVDRHRGNRGESDVQSRKGKQYSEIETPCCNISEYNITSMHLG